MWNCPKCGVKVDPSFDVCWSCGTTKDGIEDPAFVREGESAETGSQQAGSTAIRADLPERKATAASIAQLIFVGLNGYAAALHRETGKIVWSNNEMHSGYVTLLLDGDRLIVSTNGYLYCLDPLTGRILWQNPMTGYGFGTATSLVSVRGQSSQVVVAQAAEITAAAASSS
jgi:outer membrane protein assembly factor BamB